jgi:DNA-binding transcriptional ArsR family regulator
MRWIPSNLPLDAGSGGCRRRLPDEQVDLAGEVSRMFAEPTRVRLLWALVDREMPVHELAEQVGKAPARSRSTWPSCAWRGWYAPAGRAHRCSTGWTTTTSHSWSPTPCSTPSTPAPASRPTHQDDATLTRLHVAEDSGQRVKAPAPRPNPRNPADDHRSSPRARPRAPASDGLGIGAAPGVDGRDDPPSRVVPGGGDSAPSFSGGRHEDHDHRRWQHGPRNR